MHVPTVLLKIFLTICAALFQIYILPPLSNNSLSAQLVYRFLVSLLIIWIIFPKTVLFHFSELQITFLHSNLSITFLTTLALSSKKNQEPFCKLFKHWFWFNSICPRSTRSHAWPIPPDNCMITNYIYCGPLIWIIALQISSFWSHTAITKLFWICNPYIYICK